MSEPLVISMKSDLGESSGDVEDLGPGERLPAGQGDKRDAEVAGLGEDADELLLAHLRAGGAVPGRGRSTRCSAGCTPW